MKLTQYSRFVEVRGFNCSIIAGMKNGKLHSLREVRPENAAREIEKLEELKKLQKTVSADIGQLRRGLASPLTPSP